MKVKASEVLELAQVHIEKGWCKHSLRDIHGNVCAIGAVLLVQEELAKRYHTGGGYALNKTTEELGWGPCGLIAFNNHRDTTQDDVLAVFQKTICRLQERGE